MGYRKAVGSSHTLFLLGKRPAVDRANLTTRPQGSGWQVERGLEVQWPERSHFVPAAKKE